MPTPEADPASEQPPDHDPSADPTPSGLKPLSRNASRALVIASILFVIGATGGGTWLILHLARSGPPPQEAVSPADTAETTYVPPDTTRGR